jgi:prolyl-tRNA synthetase
MLWSKLFTPTLRASPSGEPLSRQLLQRAGYLRGADRWLPLGQRSLGRIARIIRSQLDAAGGQEMRLPDAAAFELIAREVRSYKQLPQLWYRFGTEMDARTFSLDPAPLDEVCRRALDRCGVGYAVTERSLAVYAEEGAEPIAACSSCAYASPMEIAEATASKPAAEDPPGDLAPEPFHTPGRKTIAEVAEFVGLPESGQMKSLILVANDAPVLVMLRGDHQLSEAKFAAAVCDSRFRAARSDELFEWFGAGAGSLGPVGVKNMRILMDRALAGRRNMIAGANRDDYHLRNVTPGQDFQAEVRDLRQIAAGEACARCVAPLEERKAMELARFDPPRPMPDLHVANAEAKETASSMSGFSIRVERILNAAAIAGNDADGLILPRAIAPFDVIVTPANYREAAQRQAAHSIYDQCARLELECLLDDRDERPGVKFKDADLIGVPYRITVGKKLAEGRVEIVERKSKQTKDAAAADAAAAVNEAITGGATYSA